MNARQQRFVTEYLIDLNQTQAAIRAGYSVGSAEKMGAELLRKSGVSDAIARAMAERSRVAGINADRILRELGDMVLTDRAELFDATGRLRPFHEMPRGARALIAGFKVRRVRGADGEPEELIEVKLSDQTALLTLAMRHLGMLNDKLTLDASDGLAEAIAAGRKRAHGDSESGAPAASVVPLPLNRASIPGGAT